TFPLGEGNWFSLPAVIIMALSTIILIIGIRESATTNALLVITKVGVILFVIGVGCWYINPAKWTRIPPEYRKPTDVPELLERYPEIAQYMPEGNPRYISGESLIKPEVLRVITQTIENQIRQLPSAELAERPDLARYLPQRVLIQIRDKQTLE